MNPNDAVKYGRCPGPFCDGEVTWLFRSDCSEDAWCDGCIDEAHERSHDALDYDPYDPLDFIDDEPNWEDEQFYEDEGLF